MNTFIFNYSHPTRQTPTGLELPLANPWLDSKPSVSGSRSLSALESPSQKSLPNIQGKTQSFECLKLDPADSAQPAANGAPVVIDHPILTGVGGAVLAYALWRNYRPGAKTLGTKSKTTETEKIDLHFAELARLVSRLKDADPEAVPKIYAEICQKIRRQADFYEERAAELTVQIGYERALASSDDADPARLTDLMVARHRIIRDFQQDVAILDGLMEHWAIRQLPQSHATLREIEERYFKLEDNPLKAIPMYGFNFSNSMSTLIGALVALSVLNLALPLLLHDVNPELFPAVANAHGHWTMDKFTGFLRQMAIFGLSLDVCYAGYKGLRCRNTNSRLARSWNSVLDGLAAPYLKVVDPVWRLINRSIHDVVGKPWEVVTRYGYRATSLGAQGIIRQIGRDICFSLNDLATGALHLIDPAAPAIRPFGYIGDVSVGLLIGGVFDWSVGVFENIMQNIIVKIPADSLSRKVGLALEDLFGLVWDNAAPTAVCNAMHSNATARVSQHPKNDDIDVVMSRYVLGVMKGSLLTALISTPAINSHAEAATAVYIGAQVFIGGNSILFSLAITNGRVRDRAAQMIAKVKHMLCLDRWRR